MTIPGANTDTTEQTDFQPEKDFMSGYYDKKDEEVKYLSFIEDLQEAVSNNEDKILAYLSKDLFLIQEDPEFSDPTRIKYKDTDDRNVTLMQEKLSDLGAFDKSIQDLEFHNKRSYIISTFRILFASTRIINNTKENYTQEQLVSEIKELVKQQTTSQNEMYFREEDYQNGLFQSLFKDANIKKNKGYINPEGKVTEKEIGMVIFPSVIKVLQGLEYITQRVSPFSPNRS